mmetsp:Transcript_56551/g.115268  ORF Transcript_56551/g.115268 Transcript_56551/m.115268 type:complete len:211 (-) Transcript_56551:26-658(-)
MRRRKMPSSCTKRSHSSGRLSSACLALSHQFSSCSSSAKGPLKCQSMTARAITAGTAAAICSAVSLTTSDMKLATVLTGCSSTSKALFAEAQTAGRSRCACIASLVEPRCALRLARLANRASCSAASPNRGSTSSSHRSSRSSTGIPNKGASPSSLCRPESAGHTCCRISRTTGHNSTECTRPLTLHQKDPSVRSEGCRPNRFWSSSACC